MYRAAEAMVEAGKFDSLLHAILRRNKVIIPPLRRRPEDISALLQQEVDALNQKNGMSRTLEPGFEQLVQKMDSCIAQCD